MDEHYMNIAFDLAQSTKGQTSPNPMVGAVVVQNHHIVGMGAHLKAGEPHAEVQALNMAGQKAKGATLYVTLEPCSHYGRTPPCADKVIQTGVTRVVIGTLDPNPLVAGRGMKKLQEAGIEVLAGVLQKECEQLNEVYNHYIVNKTPFVTLKTATTLDGKIATASGESKWITGEEARADGHRLRHQHDALLVGVQTVMQDDPQLTTRLEGAQGKHPLRIVLDSRLRTPLGAQLLNTTEAPTWIFTTQQADQEKFKFYEEKGVRLFQTNDESRLSLERVLHIIGKEKVASLLVEGGGEINASFLQGKYVNKVISYVAPKLIGGHLAPSSFRGEGFASLADAMQLYDVQCEMVGNDFKISGYVR